MVEKAIFKKCPMCFFEWKTRDEFLDDKKLNINGYLADFDKLEWGLFLFTHHKTNCFSTLAIRAEDFLSLYSGPRYKERRTGKEDCPGYCLDKNQLDRCDALCECAFNREVIQIIKKRQKKNRSYK